MPASDEHPYLRPVLRELVRTRVCDVPIELLVDRIDVLYSAPASASALGCYCLWLSDGKWAIRGFLRRELYPFIASGALQEGTFILLTDYRLLKGLRQGSESELWHVVAEKLQIVGHDGRALENDGGILDLNEAGATEEGAVKTALSTQVECGTASPQEVLVPSRQLAADATPGNVSGHALPKRNARKRGATEPPLSASSPSRLNERSESIKRCKTQPSSAAAESRRSKASATAARKPPRPIARRVEITPLADVIGTKKSRNKVRDVCAVICAVDSEIIQRRGLPDQRDLRIMDLSTEKQVQLTVFVDALKFRPSVGTVALFRNVSTHTWDNGSLKAYPRDCAGREWYFPEPTDIAGCDVEALHARWTALEKEAGIAHAKADDAA